MDAKVGFTFQYGYILIRRAAGEEPINEDLYIPIWLYSNMDLKLATVQGRLLYIPIWLYSNRPYPTI